MLHAPDRSPERNNPADALAPLGRGSDRRDVLNALIDMIHAAGLRIGDRLPPEMEIAGRLGIGRAKVREALVAWQNMGIVTRNKKAGTRLAAEVEANTIHIPVSVKLEAESLLRMLAVRRPLETEAVRYATRNATDPQRRTIRQGVAELLTVYDAGEDWRAADHRFHAAIHEASANPLFGQLIRQIQQAFDEIYAAPFGQPHLGADTIPLHGPLADAIVAGDEAAGVAIMLDILTRVEAEVRLIIGEMDERHA